MQNSQIALGRWGAQIGNLFDRRYVRALTGADNVWQGTRRKLTVWVEFLR